MVLQLGSSVIINDNIRHHLTVTSDITCIMIISSCLDHDHAYFEYLTIGAATVTNLSDKSKLSGLIYVISAIDPFGEA